MRVGALGSNPTNDTLKFCNVVYFNHRCIYRLIAGRPVAHCFPFQPVNYNKCNNTVHDSVYKIILASDRKDKFMGFLV